MALHVKCRECKSEFRADVQMDPESFKTATIEDFSQDCPFCGKTNTYSKADILVKD